MDLSHDPGYPTTFRWGDGGSMNVSCNTNLSLHAIFKYYSNIKWHSYTNYGNQARTPL